MSLSEQIEQNNLGTQVKKYQDDLSKKFPLWNDYEEHEEESEE